MNPLRNLGFLLKDVSRLYVRRFEERARSVGLTLPQCRVLVYLERNEGISQAQLADLTELEPMTLVRILDYMEVEGWVERRAAPADRRARSLYLKPKAKPLVEHIWSLVDDTRGEALAAVSKEHAMLMMHLLERIRANFLNLEPLALPASAPVGLPARVRGAVASKRRAVRGSTP